MGMDCTAFPILKSTAEYMWHMMPIAYRSAARNIKQVKIKSKCPPSRLDIYGKPQISMTIH